MPRFEFMNTLYKLRWLCGCLLFFACSSNTGTGTNPLVITTKDSLAEVQKIDRAWLQIAELKKLIRPGDLIVRTGNDFTSESLRSLNQRNQDFSHCGIASIEHDSLFVYHSLGGEWNPDQKIRRDPIEVFAEPYSNRGVGLFRYDITNEDITKLLATVWKHYQDGIMFDMKFDLVSDDRMYCAEFVCKSYQAGTKGKLIFNISHIGKFAFYGVDDLFLHPQCKEIGRIDYK